MLFIMPKYAEKYASRMDIGRPKVDQITATATMMAVAVAADEHYDNDCIRPAYCTT